MQDLSLLAIPAFALALAAVLVWDSRRSAHRLSEQPVRVKNTDE